MILTYLQTKLQETLERQVAKGKGRGLAAVDSLLTSLADLAVVVATRSTARADASHPMARMAHTVADIVLIVQEKTPQRRRPELLGDETAVSLEKALEVLANDEHQKKKPSTNDAERSATLAIKTLNVVNDRNLLSARNAPRIEIARAAETWTTLRNEAIAPRAGIATLASTSLTVFLLLLLLSKGSHLSSLLTNGFLRLRIVKE